MYRGLSILALAPVFNEERKIVEVVRRTPRDVIDELLIIDDGSIDGSAKAARSRGANVLSLGRTAGVGAALREGFDYGKRRGYDIVVVMAGNNKDAPEEIPRLLDPIAEGRADFVQGSRYLKQDGHFGEMPVYRRFATQLHALLFSIVSGHRVTESTNGFRAIRTAILKDPSLDLKPAWLDQYELEVYLYLRVIQLGYRTAEVPVSKIYPPRALGQTKMPPLTGWWSILRPLAYAALGRR